MEYNLNDAITIITTSISYSELLRYFEQFDTETVEKIYYELEDILTDYDYMNTKSNLKVLREWLEKKLKKENSEVNLEEMKDLVRVVRNGLVKEMLPRYYHTYYYDYFNKETKEFKEDYAKTKLYNLISNFSGTYGLYLKDVVYRSYIYKKNVSILYYVNREVNGVSKSVPVVYSPILTLGLKGSDDTLAIAYNGTTKQVSFKVNGGAVNYIKIETGFQEDYAIEKVVLRLLNTYLYKGKLKDYVWFRESNRYVN